MSRNSLLEIGAISEVEVTATGLELTSQANIEGGFILKRVRDMIRTYSHYFFILLGIQSFN